MHRTIKFRAWDIHKKSYATCGKSPVIRNRYFSIIL